MPGKTGSATKEWKTVIEELGEKAAKATGEKKAELAREIEELSRKREKAKEKWSELKKASDTAWDAVSEGAEKAAAELKAALESIVSRFK